MRVLFIGGLFSEEMEQEIISNTKSGAVQYAANKFQNNIICGLKNIKSINLEILSAPFVGTFPKEYKKVFFRGSGKFNHQNIKYNYISFVNLWGIRNVFRKKKLINELVEFIKFTDKEKTILVYSPHTPFLEAAVYAKTKDSNIKICMIVPDLPQYMNLNKNKTILYRILKIFDIMRFQKLSKSVDSFILITEQMKDKLNVGNRPYIVVEGIIDNNITDYEIQMNNCNIKTITYTGTLSKKFGIENLITAFSLIDDKNLKLNICGAGDAADFVKQASQKDKRINYLGQLTNQEALKIQRESTILINPRTNNEEFTKYSFPYKTMEYLMSGCPVISYKLDGIPNEYDEYLNYIENESVDSIKMKILEVLELSDIDRNDIGLKAKRFVIENKNCNVIGLKIYKHLVKSLNM